MRLSKLEIDVVLAMLGDVDPAHFESWDGRERTQRERAHDRVIEKLNKARRRVGNSKGIAGMSIAQRMKLEERKVATFNAEIDVGAPVYYRKDRGEIVETHTRTAASLLSGHTAIVWLEGISGCVAIDRVTPRESESI